MCERVSDAMNQWFKKYLLYLNVGKTRCIRFHNRQKELDFDSFGDLQSADVSALFLGVHFDGHLSWNNHCRVFVKKLNPINYQLLIFYRVPLLRCCELPKNARLASNINLPRMRMGFCYLS